MRNKLTDRKFMVNIKTVLVSHINKYLNIIQKSIFCLITFNYDFCLQSKTCVSFIFKDKH